MEREQLKRIDECERLNLIWLNLLAPICLRVIQEASCARVFFFLLFCFCFLLLNTYHVFFIHCSMLLMLMVLLLVLYWLKIALIIFSICFVSLHLFLICFHFLSLLIFCDALFNHKSIYANWLLNLLLDCSV